MSTPASAVDEYRLVLTYHTPPLLFSGVSPCNLFDNSRSPAGSERHLQVAVYNFRYIRQNPAEAYTNKGRQVAVVVVG